MCEIQFVASTKFDEENIDDFTFLLENGSRWNGDATGVFGKGFVWKIADAYVDMKKKPSKELTKLIEKKSTNWLIGHNRLATTGSETISKNNHPFRNDECIVVHNGILSNHSALKNRYDLKYPEQTDSAIVPHLITHFLQDGDNEVEAIKSTAEEIRGSYSIFVYYRKTGNLYYFKNSSTNFEFMRTESYDGSVSIYGSTNANALALVGCELANGSFTIDTMKSRVEMTPKSGVVYAVDTNTERMSIMKACSFKPQANLPTYTNYRGSWSGTDVSAYDTYYGTTANADEQTSLIESDGYIDEWLDKHNMDIMEAFEECCNEIEKISAYDDWESGVAKTLYQDTDICFYDSAYQVVLRNLDTTLGYYLVNYLDAKEWMDSDTNMSAKNYTVNYNDVVEFLIESHQTNTELTV